MPSIPVSSPLMLMFSAPEGADKPASPLLLEGESAEFSAMFSQLLSPEKPPLDQAGLSPLLDQYGNRLPLTDAEGQLLKREGEAISSETSPTTEQEGMEDLALFLAQLGYVVAGDQANADAQARAEGKAGADVSGQQEDAVETPSAKHLLDETTAREQAEKQVESDLKAEQSALARQQAEQQTEKTPPLTPLTETVQKRAQQTASTAAAQPNTSAAESLKQATEPTLERRPETPADERFLKTGLNEAQGMQNMASKDTQGAAKPIDLSLSTLQPSPTTAANAQTGSAGLQSTPSNPLSTPVQASQVNTSESFAGASVPKDILDMGKDVRQWGNNLSQRIVTMVADDVQQARIQLDPPELGSLQVRLQIQQDQASVQVQVQHGHVREALENNAFRLRDALANQGIELDGFDVDSDDQAQSGFQQSANEQGEEQGQEQAAASGAGSSTGLMTDEAGETLDSDAGSAFSRPRSVNLLDTFA